MSWLFAAREPGLQTFDETVDKATSELVPTDSDESLLLSLQLSDLIRSKQLEAATALKSVRRRLAHTNPNVKIQSLHVLDVLVKNSGEAFLVAVANGKDGWATQLEDTCKSSNNDLRQLALQSLQNWALAFQSQQTSKELSSSDLVGLYNRLRFSLSFPPVSQAMTSSMITSMSAPEWVDADLCQRCRTPFTVTNRKHHCRNCGGVFCGECSSKKMKLEHLGIEQEVRVCDGCHKKLSTPGAKKTSFKPPSDSSSPPQTSRSLAAVGSNGAKSQEEIDFERAIAMSLAESGPQPATNGQQAGSSSLPGVGYGYGERPVQSSPYPTLHHAKAAPAGPSKQLEEEDPDLAAAIRASLADVAAASPPVASSSSTPYQPYQASAPYIPQAPTAPSVPSYELAMSEFDALDAFSNVLPARQVSLDDANELFYRADRHRGKMLRGLEDSRVKAEMLDELNAKLQRAVRLYDSLLERRLSSYRHSYQQPQQQYNQPYQQPRQQYYQPSQQAQQNPHSQFQPANQQDVQRYTSPAPAQQAHTPYNPVYGLQYGASTSSPALDQQHTGYDSGAPNLHRQSSLAYDNQPYSSEDPQQQHHDHMHARQPGSEERQNVHVPQYSDGAYTPHPSVPYMSPPLNQEPALHPAGEAAAPPFQPQQDFNFPTSPSRQIHVPLVAEHQTMEAVPMSDTPLSQGAPHAGFDVNANGHRDANDVVAYGQQSQAPMQLLQHQRPPQQLFDAQGHKLKLQGMYSSASFPSVPQLPVGGLPNAHNGELTNYNEHNHEAHEPVKKQEEALIEF